MNPSDSENTTQSTTGFVNCTHGVESQSSWLQLWLTPSPQFHPKAQSLKTAPRDFRYPVGAAASGLIGEMPYPKAQVAGCHCPSHWPRGACHFGAKQPHTKLCANDFAPHRDRLFIEAQRTHLWPELQEVDLEQLGRQSDVEWLRRQHRCSLCAIEPAPRIHSDGQPTKVIPSLPASLNRQRCPDEVSIIATSG